MQFRLRLVAALKKELKRLTGSTEGVTSISTGKLGEEEGVTKAIAEGVDEGGRAARKSEKVGRIPQQSAIKCASPLPHGVHCHSQSSNWRQTAGCRP